MIRKVFAHVYKQVIGNKPLKVTTDTSTTFQMINTMYSNPTIQNFSKAST